MNVKRNLVVIVIVILAGLAIANNQQTSTGTTEQAPRLGFTAPHFSLTALDQATYTVAGKREKPVVLNFWASWCGPCRLEAPALRDLYLDYRDKIDFYAVNMTAFDRLEGAKAFVDEFQLPFPILLDETGDVSKTYQVASIPTTYFVDEDGVIRYYIIGAADRATFEKQVKALLN